MSESRGLEIPFCHEVKCSEERGEGGRGRRERRGGGRRGHITRGVQVSIPKMCFLIERCPTHVHQLIHIQAHTCTLMYMYICMWITSLDVDQTWVAVSLLTPLQ